MAMNKNERAVKWIFKEATYYTKQPNRYNFYNQYDEFVGTAFYDSTDTMTKAIFLPRNNDDRYSLRYNPERDGEQKEIGVWITQKIQADASASNAPPAIKRRKRDDDPEKNMIFGTPDDTGATTSPAPSFPSSPADQQRNNLMEDLRSWKSASRKSKKNYATTRKVSGKKAARKAAPKQNGLLQRVARVTGIHLNRK